MSSTAPIAIMSVLGLLFAVALSESADAQQHEMPTPMQLLQMTPQELQKALDDIERKAKDLPEESRAIRMRFVARARAARINIGIHGEIIFLSKCLWPQEYYHLFVENKDGSAAIMKEPMDPSTTFASISKKGEVKLAKPGKAGSPALNALPKTWPFKDKKGNVTAPKVGTAVLRPQKKARAKTKVPPDALGWLYLDLNNSLNAPPKRLEPFPNVIWVYRESDGGLRLEHSGPEDTGVYARVSRDGRTTYTNPRRIKKPPPGQAYYWGHFSHEDGIPCMLPPEGTVCPVSRKEPPQGFTIDRFGNIYTPGRVIR